MPNEAALLVGFLQKLFNVLLALGDSREVPEQLGHQLPGQEGSCGRIRPSAVRQSGIGSVVHISRQTSCHAACRPCAAVSVCWPLQVIWWLDAKSQLKLALTKWTCMISAVRSNSSMQQPPCPARSPADGTATALPTCILTRHTHTYVHTFNSAGCVVPPATHALHK